MFELTIAKNELLPRLLMTIGAVDKRQSLPILANVLFQIDNNQLILTATDLEIEISSYFKCNMTLSNSKTTIPAKKLIDIIRSLDDNSHPMITLNNSGIIIIKAARSQFKLATLPAEQFPDSNYEKPDIELSLARSNLIHLLQMTHFAISQQDVRIFLNGLLFEFNTDNITTVATDGCRMAICKLHYVTNFPPLHLLLPRKGVLEMLRLLNSVTDESITIMASKSYFRVTTEHYVFTSKLIDARFPPYTKAIPLHNDKIILIEKDNLKRALSRIVILAREKSHAIMLHTQTGMLTLTANNKEEEAIETLEATISGDEIKIGINASYVLDVLSYMPDGLVRLSMSTTDRSILVESLNDKNYQYIIMPMKL